MDRWQTAIGSENPIARSRYSLLWLSDSADGRWLRAGVVATVVVKFEAQASKLKLPSKFSLGFFALRTRIRTRLF